VFGAKLRREEKYFVPRADKLASMLAKEAIIPMHSGQR
jgi:hypothetical protein